MSDSPRLLACLACGDPLEVPEGGGEVACQCGASHNWAPRPGQRSTVLPKPDRTPNETDDQYEERRLAYLRKQADEGVSNSTYATFDAPPGLSHLELAYDDPTLPGLLTEAFRRAVERCEETHGAMDAERNLFWIASKSKNAAMLSGGDRRRGFAWLQTTGEIIRDPGFQHVLVCNLADQARNNDDLDGARGLLDRSDPTPWQLPLDSQYRTSAGMLTLALDDVEGTLRLVGERNDQVPFTEACVYQACFMRTAALERAGRPEEAEAAAAFNVERLPKEIIDDWLDGSTTLAPVKRVLERIEEGGDDDASDSSSLTELLSSSVETESVEPEPLEQVSITPASPRTPNRPKKKSHRALWIMSAVLVLLGASAWVYAMIW